MLFNVLIEKGMTAASLGLLAVGFMIYPTRPEPLQLLLKYLSFGRLFPPQSFLWSTAWVPSFVCSFTEIVFDAVRTSAADTPAPSPDPPRFMNLVLVHLKDQVAADRIRHLLSAVYWIGSMAFENLYVLLDSAVALMKTVIREAAASIAKNCSSSLGVRMPFVEACRH